MSYRGDHRRSAVKNSAGYFFFIKGPEILYGTSASSNDHYIHTGFIQHTDTLYNTVRSSFSLYQCRIEDDLDIRISSQRNIADILYGRSCRRSYHTQSSDKFRNGLFIFLGKHSHFFQFSFQSKKTFVQNAFSFLGDLLCIKLITSVPLVNVHSSAHYHLISVFHAECQSAPVSGKHHAGKNSCLIFQRKINMSAWVIFTVGNLTLYIYLFQDKILKEHIFYIAVDLTYGINSFHFQFLLSSDDGCSFFF